MNLATILVCLVLAALIALAVVHLLRQRKTGGCSGSCAG